MGDSPLYECGCAQGGASSLTRVPRVPECVLPSRERFSLFGFGFCGAFVLFCFVFFLFFVL